MKAVAAIVLLDAGVLPARAMSVSGVTLFQPGTAGEYASFSCLSNEAAFTRTGSCAYPTIAADPFLNRQQFFVPAFYPGGSMITFSGVHSHDFQTDW